MHRMSHANGCNYFEFEMQRFDWYSISILYTYDAHTLDNPVPQVGSIVCTCPSSW